MNNTSRVSSILNNNQINETHRSLHRSESVSSLTSLSTAKNQRLTVSDCLNGGKHIGETAAIQQKPTKFSKIEMLLNDSTFNCSITKAQELESCNLSSSKNENIHYFNNKQKATLKKKNNFINRKTIRNYTVAAAAAAAVTTCASTSFSDSDGNQGGKYLQRSQSYTSTNTLTPNEDNANLKMLVEVAVSLWEEQQRNYEYRN